MQENCLCTCTAVPDKNLSLSVCTICWLMLVCTVHKFGATCTLFFFLTRHHWSIVFFFFYRISPPMTHPQPPLVATNPYPAPLPPQSHHHHPHLPPLSSLHPDLSSSMSSSTSSSTNKWLKRFLHHSTSISAAHLSA